MVELKYRYENTEHAELLKKNYFSDRILNFCIETNIYLIPKTKKGKTGGLYHEGGQLIKDTSTNLEYGCDFFEFNCGDIKSTFEKPCIYLGVLESCWGHFITDSLKKLWFLKSKYYSQFNNYELVFIAEPGFQLKENYSRLLELAGLDLSKVTILQSHTLLKKVLIPDSCFFYDSSSVIHYTKEYIKLIDSIKYSSDVAKDSKYEKIYYSYSRYKKKNGYKKTFGEEKLEHFFKKQGFQIIYPEQHTFDEQLSMMLSCKMFASTEGSTSHNSVFVNDDATIIIIPRGPYFSGYQQTIDSITNKNTIYYIDSCLTAFSSKNGPWSGPNYFYVSDELINFFSVKGAEIKRYQKKNFKDVSKYIKYCLVDLSGRDYFVKNIYSEKFFNYLGRQKNRLFLFYRILYITKKIFYKIFRIGGQAK